MVQVLEQRGWFTLHPNTHEVTFLCLRILSFIPGTSTLTFSFQFGFNLSFRAIVESLNERISSFFVQINGRCVYLPSYFLISHQKQAGFEVLGNQLETVEQNWCRNRSGQSLLSWPLGSGWGRDINPPVGLAAPQKPSPPLHQCMTYEPLPRSFSVHFRSSKSTAHEETQCSFETAPRSDRFNVLGSEWNSPESSPSGMRTPLRTPQCHRNPENCHICGSWDCGNDSPYKFPFSALTCNNLYLWEDCYPLVSHISYGRLIFHPPKVLIIAGVQFG